MSLCIKSISCFLFFNILSTIFIMGIDIYPIISLVLFYKLVWRINHQEVFSWKNVRTLRKIALYLILFAVFSTGSSLMNAYQMNQAFALEGYSVNYLGCFSFLSFLLGMVSLIVAEVFSIGLKMQEEQELTI